MRIFFGECGPFWVKAAQIGGVGDGGMLDGGGHCRANMGTWGKDKSGPAMGESFSDRETSNSFWWGAE